MTVHGAGFACGREEKNWVRLFLDSASAAVLSEHLMCTAVRPTLCSADKKWQQPSRGG